MGFRRVLPLISPDDHEVGEARPDADALGNIAFGLDPTRIGQTIRGHLLKARLARVSVSGERRGKARDGGCDLAGLVTGRYLGRRNHVEPGKTRARLHREFGCETQSLPPVFATHMHKQVSKHFIPPAVRRNRPQGPWEKVGAPLWRDLKLRFDQSVFQQGIDRDDGEGQAEDRECADDEAQKEGFGNGHGLKLLVQGDSLAKISEGRPPTEADRPAAADLDQAGRLGLAPVEKGYKPSQADLQDFQLALQGELQKLGM